MKLEELSELTSKPRAEISNAVIESTSISIEDHGVLTAWLFLEFGGSGCGFGGYCLGKRRGGNLSDKNYAGEFLVRVLNVVGYEKWENLKGKPLRALHTGLGGGILAIGNYLKDEWFCPSIEFKDQE